MIYKKGFTLAEVLITIAIIGVIAALTVPIVVEKYREQRMVTALKKFYSDINKVYQAANLKSIDIEYAGIDSTQALFDYFKPYLKIIKDCNTTSTECFYNGAYASLGPQNWGWMKSSSGSSARYNVVLADGVSVSFFRANSANNNVLGEINIDLNGPERPNKFGFDTFFFLVTNKGFIPGGMNIGYQEYQYNMSDMATKCRLNVNDGNNGRGCTAWALIKGNLDYLKKDVNW